MNLLEKFSTPFESFPFEDIKQEDFKPAILAAIENAKQEIKEIENNPLPTCVNTIVALENVGKKLGVLTTAFFNLNSAETNDYIQELAIELSPQLTELVNDIYLNQQLFDKIQISIDGTLKSKLSQEEITLLDKTYKNFVRNGILLSESDKIKLREIDKELTTLSLRFGQNVLKETNNYFLHIKEENDLAGLPDSIRSIAKREAEARNLKGWVFTLQFPSYIPFLKYSENRELRKEIYKASMSRAFKSNEYNNEEIVKNIITLRNQRASLLGYQSHADFVLQERMALTPKNVFTFLDELLEKAKPAAISEIEELQQLAKSEGISKLMPYDHAFYAEKLRQSKFNLVEEELKAYFPLENVLHAIFNLSNQLFGLEFKKREDIQKYNEEVAVYEVLEKNKHKALLYLDFFPRKGKRAGAWMTSYKGQYKTLQESIRPHVSIVCNFTCSDGDIPSLLTFNEVRTLFHEFGHALHLILADTNYESLSGTNVYWDFVELPSQFMENFCYEKEFLVTFAKHYKTGETLREDKINNIIAASNFMEGYQTMRQIAFGLLDMAYHTDQFSSDSTIKDFENKILKDTSLYPDIIDTCISTSFSHIFQGGYSAGYYSYKWAEVLDADAFSFFKETGGIFNSDTALRWRTLLSKGGTEHPMDLYIEFRGRKPNPDALLKRAGLISG